MDSTVAECPALPARWTVPSPSAVSGLSCCMRPGQLLLYCLQACQGGGRWRQSPKEKELFGKLGSKFSDPHNSWEHSYQSRDDKELRQIGLKDPISIIPAWLTRIFPSTKSAFVKRRAELKSHFNIFRRLLPWPFNRSTVSNLNQRKIHQETSQNRFSAMNSKNHDLSRIPRSRPVHYQQMKVPPLFQKKATERQSVKGLNSWHTQSPWIPMHIPERSTFSEPWTSWSHNVNHIRQTGRLSDSQLQFSAHREAREGWTPLAETYHHEENDSKDEEGSALISKKQEGIARLSFTTQRPRKYYTSQPWRDLYRD